jgi:hypothetical protein
LQPKNASLAVNNFLANLNFCESKNNGSKTSNLIIYRFISVKEKKDKCIGVLIPTFLTKLFFIFCSFGAIRIFCFLTFEYFFLKNLGTKLFYYNE